MTRSLLRKAPMTDDDTPRRNKELIERFHARLWGDGDVGVIDEVIASANFATDGHPNQWQIGALVKAIFVNIFGGIMDCNVIATGIVESARETGLKLPLVVRLEGNNVEAGKKTLSESGLTIISATNLDDAAKKIVAAVQAA